MKILTLDENNLSEICNLMQNYYLALTEFHQKIFIDSLKKYYSQKNIKFNLKNSGLDKYGEIFKETYYGIKMSSNLTGILINRDYDSAPEVNWISTLYAHEKKQGIGHYLMDHLFNKSLEVGKSQIGLAVEEKNIPARKFYEKMGFEEESREKEEFMSTIYLWKNL